MNRSMKQALITYLSVCALALGCITAQAGVGQVDGVVRQILEHLRITSGGVYAPVASDLGDVDVSGAADSDTLRYDGSGAEWVDTDGLKLDDAALTATVKSTWTSIFASGGLRLTSATGVAFISSAGSPEGVISAPIGSLYGRTNGTTNTSVYRKEAGASDSAFGWVAMSAGVGGSTGATDNAVLRADGTGGSTMQSTDVTISDVSGSSVTVSTTTGNNLIVSPASAANLTLRAPNGILDIGDGSTAGLRINRRMIDGSEQWALDPGSGGTGGGLEIANDASITFANGGSTGFPAAITLSSEADGVLDVGDSAATGQGDGYLLVGGMALGRASMAPINSATAGQIRVHEGQGAITHLLGPSDQPLLLASTHATGGLIARVGASLTDGISVLSSAVVIGAPLTFGYGNSYLTPSSTTTTRLYQPDGATGGILGCSALQAIDGDAMLSLGTNGILQVGATAMRFASAPIILGSGLDARISTSGDVLQVCAGTTGSADPGDVVVMTHNSVGAFGKAGDQAFTRFFVQNEIDNFSWLGLWNDATDSVLASGENHLLIRVGGAANGTGGTTGIAVTSTATVFQQPALLSVEGATLATSSSGDPYGTRVCQRVCGESALTDATVTTVATIAVASGSVMTGEIRCAITATDGTDFQSNARRSTFAVTNKAGVLVVDIDDDVTASNAESAVSTLVTTFSAVAGTNDVAIRASANSSLTTPTLTCRFELVVFGAGAVTLP